MESFKDWCLNNERNDLLEEWDTAKNSNISIDKISAGSAKSVWWIKHYDDPRTGKHFVFEWKTPINVRTYGNSKCPYLINYKIYTGFNDLATIYPELVAEWHQTKNGDLKPDMVSYKSSKNVWWILHYDDPETKKHFDFEWKASISSRAAGSGCPYLKNQKVFKGYNDLARLKNFLEPRFYSFIIFYSTIFANKINPTACFCNIIFYVFASSYVFCLIYIT